MTAAHPGRIVRRDVAPVATIGGIVPVAFASTLLADRKPDSHAFARSRWHMPGTVGEATFTPPAGGAAS